MKRTENIQIRATKETRELFDDIHKHVLATRSNMVGAYPADIFGLVLKEWISGRGVLIAEKTKIYKMYCDKNANENLNIIKEEIEEMENETKELKKLYEKYRKIRE